MRSIFLSMLLVALAIQSAYGRNFKQFRGGYQLYRGARRNPNLTDDDSGARFTTAMLEMMGKITTTTTTTEAPTMTPPTIPPPPTPPMTPPAPATPTAPAAPAPPTVTVTVPPATTPTARAEGIMSNNNYKKRLSADHSNNDDDDDEDDTDLIKPLNEAYENAYAAGKPYGSQFVKRQSGSSSVQRGKKSKQQQMKKQQAANARRFKQINRIRKAFQNRAEGRSMKPVIRLRIGNQGRSMLHNKVKNRRRFSEQGRNLNMENGYELPYQRNNGQRRRFRNQSRRLKNQRIFYRRRNRLL